MVRVYVLPTWSRRALTPYLRDEGLACSYERKLDDSIAAVTCMLGVFFCQQTGDWLTNR